MTAGMTTQKLEGSRVSLPRAGLGALLVATLLAGGMIGAALYAGIGIATAQPAAVSATVQHESAVVRDLRIRAGRGQLVADAATIQITSPSKARDGFDHGVPNGRAIDGSQLTFPALNHAPGTGPLE